MSSSRRTRAAALLLGVATPIFMLPTVASCFTIIRRQGSSSSFISSSTTRDRNNNRPEYYYSRSGHDDSSSCCISRIQLSAASKKNAKVDKTKEQRSSAALTDSDKASNKEKRGSSSSSSSSSRASQRKKSTRISSSSSSSSKNVTTTSSIAESEEASMKSSSSSSSQKKKSKTPRRRKDGTYSARFLGDNGLHITTDETGTVTARPKDLVELPHAELIDTLPLEEKTRQNDKKKKKKAKAKVAANEEKTLPSDNKGKSLNSGDEESGSSSSSKTGSKSLETEASTAIEEEEKSSADEKVKQKPSAAVQQQQQPQRTPSRPKQPIMDLPAKPVPKTGFNVVLTHATADFDSLASAVGLAKLWSAKELHLVDPNDADEKNKAFSSASHVPTFVVLPRGAHPGVHKFLSLHKHLFPIRSLKSLPSDLSGLNRLALVDAQRRDRLGPAEPLIQHAKRITVVDHHIDQDSDIPATDYVVDKVGSVSALICELLQESQVEVTEVEATLLALGVHADTGSLRFDSTTPRDAKALAWCLEQGASQVAIAELAQSSLSSEQQNVLTQALINANSTVVHGVTLSTVLLSADGFIQGLASVTQDALELSSSDIFIVGMVYEARSGGSRRKTKQQTGQLLTSRLLSKTSAGSANSAHLHDNPVSADDLAMVYTEAWKGGDAALKRRKLRMAFDRSDKDHSGHLDHIELKSALASFGMIASDDSVDDLMQVMDTNGNGKIDFEEFVQFAVDAEKRLTQQNEIKKKSTTMILVGRVKAGVSLKAVNLSKLFAKFGGGGHAKAASATVRLNEEAEAADIMQELVDELIQTSLQEQPTVGDFMTAPVLSLKPQMTETQVEDLFTRYDVRALPVVDAKNDVIGLVTYKEVASAKQRLWNKEQKRIRLEREHAERDKNNKNQNDDSKQRHFEQSKAARGNRKSGSMVKGWMLQHVRTVEASKTMAEVESVLLEADVGCIPVVADGTNQLVGMVTRTDLLRQHRYYNSLYYNNRGMSDSIANRRPAIIALRKKLKQFDLEDE